MREDFRDIQTSSNAVQPSTVPPARQEGAAGFILLTQRQDSLLEQGFPRLKFGQLCLPFQLCSRFIVSPGVVPLDGLLDFGPGLFFSSRPILQFGYKFSPGLFCYPLLFSSYKFLACARIC